ncbi:MAG: FtsH protease activity modulator HflK, partial [Deltaproteobacteria bacterium]|nr:FtsH protease activity modulator HflK [Deltaproteobacteria bacterium]
MDDNDWGSNAEKKVVEAARRFSGRKPPKKLLLALVVGLLVFWGATSSFFKVNTEETGVVLRFGKFSRFAQPGLNFKLPFGIDDVYLVPTGRNLKEEFGFRT